MKGSTRAAAVAAVCLLVCCSRGPHAAERVDRQPAGSFVSQSLRLGPLCGSTQRRSRQGAETPQANSSSSSSSIREHHCLPSCSLCCCKETEIRVYKQLEAPRLLPANCLRSSSGVSAFYFLHLAPMDAKRLPQRTARLAAASPSGVYRHLSCCCACGGPQWGFTGFCSKAR